jgi:formylglycine-generating enzyme required for sulfatase activity
MMKSVLSLTVFAAVSLVVGSASSQLSSIGNPGGCKRLGGSAKEACLKCVGGDNFYQTKSGTCGLAPGMKAAQPVTQDPPPARPKAMPATGTKYVTVPAGSFRIGSKEGDPGTGGYDNEFFDATVTITRPFSIKTTEVTQGEWAFIMGETTSTYTKACGLDCPVGDVSWKQALAYLNELSKRDKLEPCYDIQAKQVVWTKGLACAGYRLPTEAEWELAARGGTTAARYGDLGAVGWYDGNSDGKQHPVGKKTPNAFGLYDMLGSQWEWTWDVYDINSTPFKEGARDPIGGGLTAPFGVRGSDVGSNHVVRGGSFRDPESNMRAARRNKYLTESRGVAFGFRPVKTVLAGK